MSIETQVIKKFDINATPVDLSIMYQRQVFVIFLINSLEEYLSKIFKKIISILQIPKASHIIIITDAYLGCHYRSS